MLSWVCKIQPFPTFSYLCDLLFQGWEPVEQPLAAPAATPFLRHGATTRSCHQGHVEVAAARERRTSRLLSAPLGWWLQSTAPVWEKHGIPHFHWVSRCLSPGSRQTLFHLILSTNPGDRHLSVHFTDGDTKHKQLSQATRSTERELP